MFIYDALLEKTAAFSCYTQRKWLDPFAAAAAAAAYRLRLHTSFSAGPGPGHSIMNMKCLLIDVYGKSEWLKILDGAIGHGLDLIKFCFTSEKGDGGGRLGGINR